MTTTSNLLMVVVAAVGVGQFGCASESELIDEDPNPEYGEYGESAETALGEDREAEQDDDESSPPFDLGRCGQLYGAESAWQGDADISSQALIEELRDYRIVSGSLRIDVETAKSLDGLDALRCVGGDLMITGPVLENVEGLHNLERVEGHAMIEDVPRLARLAGLRNLRYVAGELRIRQAPEITNLDELENIEGVGHLVVAENAMLSRITVIGSPMRKVIGTLLVYNNPRLANVSGLVEIAELGNHIWFEGNTSLPTCEVKSWIEDLVAEGFDGLITVAGNDDNAACP